MVFYEGWGRHRAAPQLDVVFSPTLICDAAGGYSARRQGGFAHKVQVDAAGGGASFSDGPDD